MNLKCVQKYIGDCNAVIAHLQSIDLDDWLFLSNVHRDSRGPTMALPRTFSETPKITVFGDITVTPSGIEYRYNRLDFDKIADSLEPGLQDFLEDEIRRAIYLVQKAIKFAEIAPYYDALVKYAAARLKWDGTWWYIEKDFKGTKYIILPDDALDEASFSGIKVPLSTLKEVLGRREDRSVVDGLLDIFRVRE